MPPAKDSRRTGEFNTRVLRGGTNLNPEYLDEQEPFLAHDAADDLSIQSKPVGRDDASISAIGVQAWSGLTEFEHLPWHKRPSLLWVLIPFAILAASYGGVIVPRVQLILSLVCREYYAETSSLGQSLPMTPIFLDGTPNEQCRIGPVQSRASRFHLWVDLIAGLLSAVTSPMLGALSDRYGRNKIIAVTGLGAMVSEVSFILVARNPDHFSMNWILVGSVFDGLVGSFITTFAVVHAYVTDCVPPDQRSGAFALFHGFLFAGVAVGPACASLLVRWTGAPISPFYVLLVVHATFTLANVFIIPESLSKRRQERARAAHNRSEAAKSTRDWLATLRSLNLFAPLKILWPTGSGTRPVRINMIVLATIDVIMFGIAMGLMSTILLYANYRFGWQTYENGIYMSIIYSFRVTLLIVVLPLLNRLIRGPKNSLARATGVDRFDLAVIRTAIGFDMLGNIGFALAPTGYLWESLAF